MKTNVSIKFNSIEEYREIEKKLIELGYVDDRHLGVKTEFFTEVMVYQNKVFKGMVFSPVVDKTYNSLEEFLKD